MGSHSQNDELEVFNRSNMTTSSYIARIIVPKPTRTDARYWCQHLHASQERLFVKTVVSDVVRGQPGAFHPAYERPSRDAAT